MKRSAAIIRSSAALLAAAFAKGVEIKLPPEDTTLTASALPGYQSTQSLCLTCHSTDYIRYQPPSSSRAYWKGTVTKMQKVFAAPVPENKTDEIVDYLVKTYGAERGADAGK